MASASPARVAAIGARFRQQPGFPEELVQFFFFSVGYDEATGAVQPGCDGVASAVVATLRNRGCSPAEAGALCHALLQETTYEETTRVDGGQAASPPETLAKSGTRSHAPARPNATREEFQNMRELLCLC